MKIKKSVIVQSLLLGSFFLHLFGLSVPVFAQKGDPGERIIMLEDGKTRYQLKMDRSKKRLHLWGTDPKTPTLLEPSVTLYDSSGAFREISLEAEKPMQAGAPVRYSGALDPSQASFVGIKLRFRLGAPAGTSERVLEWRSSDPTSTRPGP